MAYFEIESGNDKNTYQLISYHITVNERGVFFTVKSLQYERSYILMADEVFKTNALISDRLDNILEYIAQNNYILKINEYFERCYVSIGYDTGIDFDMPRFTAHLLD